LKVEGLSGYESNVRASDSYIRRLRILQYEVNRFRILGYEMKRFRILEYECGAFSKICVFRILRAETLNFFKKKAHFVP
jgi:hypothetical protein